MLDQIYQIIIPRLQTSNDLAKTASDQSLLDKACADTCTLGLLTKAAMHPAMKGLMYGAGAAVPAAAAGSFLISRDGKESRKTTEDIRNKALQAAAGIAAIGGGLYAMHRKGDQTRTASAQGNPEILLDKLATVAFLDVIFENQRNNGPEPERTKAAECQLLNAEHAVDLLKHLLP